MSTADFAASQPAPATEPSSPAQVSPASDTRTAFEAKMAQVRGQPAPEPKAPASAESSKPAGQVPEAKPAGEHTARNNDEKPFKRERDNNRFGELTKRLKERESRISMLEEQLKGLKAPQARSEYDSDEKYIEALTQHAAGKTLVETQLNSEQQRRVQEERSMWTERVNSQVKDPASFEALARKHAKDIDGDTEEYIMASDHGPKMMEYILQKFEQPGAKEQFLRMPKAKRYSLLVNIEASVSSQQAQQQNQAPANPMPSLSPERGDRVPANKTTGSAFTDKLNRIRGIR